jgi:hypothetical protein
MNKLKQSKILTVTLGILIGVFVILYGYLRLGVLGPLKADFEIGNKKIEELKSAQQNNTDLLDQINAYRDGLYALNLVLEARKNVISGSDADNPYLVYDFTQVLNDLRRLLPRDARVTKFQVNNKGLITVPIESVDYASLGRVLKSFKDKSYNVQITGEESTDPMFAEVKIPSGAQRTPRQITEGWSTYFENIYSFILQADLNPEFWQNPMPYPDVDSHSYYAQAIRDLTIAGSIEGYPDGLFRPDQAINRAEFFKVALFEFLSNNTISIDEYKQYIDLSEKDWHYQYIQLASQMGIAEGDEVGRFHPDQEISRIEALKTILTIFEVEIPAIDNLNGSEQIEKDAKPLILPFTDINPQDAIYPVVRAAIDNGLLDNLKDKLNPDQPVTRAEVAYWAWKLKFDFLNP